MASPRASRLCEEIDGKVKAFFDCPIDGDWPYLLIDTTYLKVRRGRLYQLGVVRLRHRE